MLTNILITGLFRTLIELIPFFVVLSLELKGAKFRHVYEDVFDLYRDSDTLPDFTDEEGEDVDAIREIAQFSVAKHDTIKYTSYSYVVITVIFFSKIPTVLSLPFSNAVKTGIFTMGVFIWAFSSYKLYDWRTSANDFYRNVSPFKYFRKSTRERFQRSKSLPILGQIGLHRHRADFLLINGISILVVIGINFLLITAQVLTTPPVDVLSCFTTSTRPMSELYALLYRQI